MSLLIFIYVSLATRVGVLDMRAYITYTLPNQSVSRIISILALAFSRPSLGMVHNLRNSLILFQIRLNILKNFTPELGTNTIPRVLLRLTTLFLEENLYNNDVRYTAIAAHLSQDRRCGRDTFIGSIPSLMSTLQSRPHTTFCIK